MSQLLQITSNMNWVEGTFVYGLIFALIFLVLREFFTWYWKINKIVNLLEQIERNTRKEGTKIERVGAFTDGPIQPSN